MDASKNFHASLEQKNVSHLWHVDSVHTPGRSGRTTCIYCPSGCSETTSPTHTEQRTLETRQGSSHFNDGTQRRLGPGRLGEVIARVTRPPLQAIR